MTVTFFKNLWVNKPAGKNMNSAINRIFQLFFKFFLIFCMFHFIPAGVAHAVKVRKPVYAGSFYPETKPELINLIKKFTNKVKPVPVSHASGTTLKAIIMPHAGYIYSGPTAAYISLILNKNQFKRVIVLAPDHRIGFSGGAISDVGAYATPLGLIPLNKDAGRLRKLAYLFQSVPASDRVEHSVEVVLPFLQYYLHTFELIPVVLGPGSIDRYARALEPLLDKDTLMVISSDLSHYLSYDEAVARDRETIRIILNMETDKLEMRDNAACGKIPILIALNLAQRYGWKPVLLHHSNSGDTTQNRSRVVGYATIAFYGGTSMENSHKTPHYLNHSQGQTLVKLARQTIEDRLSKKSTTIDPESLKDKCFQQNRGTFVTLTINKQLRGCIGSLDSSESIIEGIKRNAVNAAFYDPRFPSLEAGELDKVDIEISILTQPAPLQYRDGNDLISRLRVNVDGVILRKGGASATFLPQVWEQLPRPEQFLSHLCLKAGLPGDTWEKNHPEILIYQVQHFEEEN